MHLLPLCALNHHKTAISKTTKSKLKTQKNRLNRRFFCKIWSECGDSNPGPPAPKAGALPTAQHPDMKLWDCPGVSSQIKRDTTFATPGYLIFFPYGSGMGQGRLTHIVIHTILTSFSTFSRGKIEKYDLFKEIKNETVAYSVLPKQARYQLRYTRL